MTKPLVSILLPVYNGGALLAACLDSIWAQTRQDYEVVVVDDGSGDDTWKMLSAAAAIEPRLKPIHMEHAGIVPALNRGLEACEGRYVARMDVDDLMLPERLAAQVEFMDDHPEVALCGTWVEPYGIDKTLSAAGVGYHDWLNSMASDEEIRTNLFVDSPIAHSTFFVRRELYQNLGGYHDPDWAEDYDFIQRAHAQGAKFGNVAQVLLRRGDRGDRLTRTDNRYRRKAMFRAKAHYLAAGNWLKGKRGVLLAGSGPSGRILADYLRSLEVPVTAFVDNHPGPPDRTVMGIPAQGFAQAPPVEFLARWADTFVALCVGESAGRVMMEQQLAAAGLMPIRDYLRFI